MKIIKLKIKDDESKLLKEIDIKIERNNNYYWIEVNGNVFDYEYYEGNKYTDGQLIDNVLDWLKAIERSIK